MKYSAIILAAGEGLRFGEKKQFIKFQGKEIWRHVYDKALKLFDEVVVVGVDCSGGKTRQDSVKIGLTKITGDKVVIFDAARPLVTEEQIKEIKSAVLYYSSVSFYTDQVDTIYEDGEYKRKTLKALQVPQAFDTKLLKKAHQKTRIKNATDDTILLNYVYPHFIKGDINLHKLTYPHDLDILNAISNSKRGETKMQKVLITGGNGDIAKAIAKILKPCYDVYLPGKDELNVTDWDNVINYITKIKPDILINCAGVITPGLVKISDPFDWEKQIKVNLIAPYYCSKIALINNAKIIVNIGSSAGSNGKAGWSAYCASKAGLISFTESLAAEGVKAYCVSPGRTATKMRERLFPGEDKKTLLAPIEVARIVLSVINGNFKDGENICISKK